MYIVLFVIGTLLRVCSIQCFLFTISLESVKKIEHVCGFLLVDFQYAIYSGTFIISTINTLYDLPFDIQVVYSYQVYVRNITPYFFISNIVTSDKERDILTSLLPFSLLGELGDNTVWQHRGFPYNLGAPRWFLTGSTAGASRCVDSSSCHPSTFTLPALLPSSGLPMFPSSELGRLQKEIGIEISRIIGEKGREKREG